MKYDNIEYWNEVHKKFGNKLQAVGHPTLCERLNQLKYESETISFLKIIEDIGNNFNKRQEKVLSILDIGTGVGYWLTVLTDQLYKQGYRLKITAVDISSDALEIVRNKYPDIQTVCDDISTIDPDIYKTQFDLVFSCYCLHHLIRLDNYLNGLRFGARSVKKDGYYIIMDPILNLPFSKFDVIDFRSFVGNGIPRHLYLIDDVLATEGFERQEILPAVSFVLNGNIEGNGKMSYMLARIIWLALYILIYKSDTLVDIFSYIICPLDRFLKHIKMGFSSSICSYKK